ncbi:MAG: GAF domain-containing protein [Leptolyngbyaceae cyanobacterium SL_7_1]|nr:GAF domain-containing protein [Leptolyngbyaceae cyanobacterium SL_7_1]
MNPVNLNQALERVYHQLGSILPLPDGLSDQQQAALGVLLDQVAMATRLLMATRSPAQPLAIQPTPGFSQPWSWIDYVSCGCLITTLPGAIVAGNQLATQLLQTEQSSLIGNCLSDWLTQPERDRLAHWLRQTASTGEVLTLETRLNPSAARWVEVELDCRLVGQVDPPHLCWSIHDLTPHRQAEDRLQQLNAELQQQVESQSAQVQKVLTFDSMLKRITDKVRDFLDESQIMQAAVRELTLVLGLAGCNSALYDLDQGTSTIRYEYTSSIPTSQGRVAQMDRFPEIYNQLQQGYSFQFCSLFPNPMRGHVAMLACPIFVDPQSSQGMDQAVLGDLWLIHHKDYVFSEFEIRLVQQVANQCAIAIRQARLYQAAQGQVRELEKLNRLKDEFLSTVSHELRTPIANVKMAIHMLKLVSTQERRQLYLDILETETAREAELIDELLDLQRLEAASYPIHLALEDVHQWLPKVADPFQFRTTNRGQRFTVHCPTLLPPLTTDFGVLQRILSELLNNACKYTAEGHEIELRVQDSLCLVEAILMPVMVFTVRNQAEIPSDELPHIFEKFYRVIQADRYKQGGTGLGLALVQKRVEQIGGIIQVESRQGWTTFTITLPTQAREARR